MTDMIKGSVLGLITLALLAGCATTGQLTSSEHAQLSDPQRQALVDDALAHLVRRYPPAQTVLALERAPGGFGRVLATQLRGAGYAIEIDTPAVHSGNGPADKSDDTKRIRYAVEPYGDEVLLVIQVPGEYQFNRLYRAGLDTAIPTNQPTVME